MKMYSLTELDLQQSANQIKDALISALEKEKLLNGTTEDIASQYYVCISKKGLFGKFVDSIFHREDKENELRWVVLKRT